VRQCVADPPTTVPGSTIESILGGPTPRPVLAAAKESILV